HRERPGAGRRRSGRPRPGRRADRGRVRAHRRRGSRRRAQRPRRPIWPTPRPWGGTDGEGLLSRASRRFRGLRAAPRRGLRGAGLLGSRGGTGQVLSRVIAPQPLAPSRTAEVMALFRALETRRPAGRLFTDLLADAFVRPWARGLLALARLPSARRLV